MIKEKEFIENYEEGTLNNYNGRRTKTDIGKACFANNITELDIFQYEYEMQEKTNRLKDNNVTISDTNILFDILHIRYFKYIDNDKIKT